MWLRRASFRRRPSSGFESIRPSHPGRTSGRRSRGICRASDAAPDDEALMRDESARSRREGIRAVPRRSERHRLTPTCYGTHAIAWTATTCCGPKRSKRPSRSWSPSLRPSSTARSTPRSHPPSSDSTPKPKRIRPCSRTRWTSSCAPTASCPRSSCWRIHQEWKIALSAADAKQREAYLAAQQHETPRPQRPRSAIRIFSHARPMRAHRAATSDLPTS